MSEQTDEEPKEGQLEVTAPRFTHLTDDQIVRLHIYDGYGTSADWDGDQQVFALEKFYRWIMEGKVPEPAEPTKKLKVVKP